MAGLLKPLSIGSLRLKNRIVMPPMATEMASQDGDVTDELVKHYELRAKDPGLIIVEHCFVDLGGRRSYRQLGIHDDKMINGLARIVKTVHWFGTPVAIQLNHAGRTTTRSICGAQPVGPSPIRALDGLEEPRELSEDELEDLAEVFSRSARRASEAGFDAVEVHGAHGFLLNQFNSPLSNRRNDRYGGSLENRISFPLLVMTRVRQAVGKDVSLFYRMGADDLTPGGFTVEEGKKFALRLVDTGVQVIDVSGGMCGSRPLQLQHQGFFIHLASEIKSVVHTPVIGVGGIRDPSFADQVVRSGKADLVAVGRAQLEDPLWATKAVKALSSTR
jgi:2,4-dienoyl-CoA reductase-like NADH-dependent reductase (Old Yellow Enzyme family)